MTPFVVSNDLLDDPPALRDRIAQEGYLFFRGLGPGDKICAARRDVIALCRDAGWCDDDGRWTGAGPFTRCLGRREARCNPGAAPPL